MPGKSKKDEITKKEKKPIKPTENKLNEEKSLAKLKKSDTKAITKKGSHKLSPQKIMSELSERLSKLLNFSSNKSKNKKEDENKNSNISKVAEVAKSKTAEGNSTKSKVAKSTQLDKNEKIVGTVKTASKEEKASKFLKNFDLLKSHKKADKKVNKAEAKETKEESKTTSQNQNKNIEKLEKTSKANENVAKLGKSSKANENMEKSEKVAKDFEKAKDQKDKLIKSKESDKTKNAISSKDLSEDISSAKDLNKNKKDKSSIKDLSKESIETQLDYEIEKTLDSKEKDPDAPKTISGEKFTVSEYYDLPYRYNETIVKLLYQTPTTLFIYWDISDKDRENLKEKYGKDFFEKTKPALLVTNLTKNYTFEVEINDFANCWYLNVADSKCKYKVELGRKPFEITYSGNVVGNNKTEKINFDYLPITSSNVIESPNDHILFEKEQQIIYFRNVKTNETTSKKIANFSLLQKLGRIRKIEEIYKKFYPNEEFKHEDIKNPSSSGLHSLPSSLNSSTFK